MHWWPYLREIAREADRCGSQFDHGKIGAGRFTGKIPVTADQMASKDRHLLGKLQRRDPERFNRLVGLQEFQPQPLFRVKVGEMADWEKTERGVGK